MSPWAQAKAWQKTQENLSSCCSRLFCSLPTTVLTVPTFLSRTAAAIPVLKSLYSETSLPRTFWLHWPHNSFNHTIQDSFPTSKSWNPYPAFSGLPGSPLLCKVTHSCIGDWTLNSLVDMMLYFHFLESACLVGLDIFNPRIFFGGGDWSLLERNLYSHTPFTEHHVLKFIHKPLHTVGRI